MATAEIRQGSVTDLYVINDPGNASGFDGFGIHILWRTPEVLVERSNNNTYKEDLLCWHDNTVVECPQDDLGGGVLRMPTLVFLDNIMAAGGVTVGPNLTRPQEQQVLLKYWHEYRTEKLINGVVDQMVLDALNTPQQKRALKFAYYGMGIDLVTAESIANARIDLGTRARWDDYGLTRIPPDDRKLLRVIGEVASEFFPD